jgi:import inner membrane translocase subunit TIM50
VPPTYLDQKRAEAQAQYREEMAYMEANKPQLEKMLQEERDAMMREGAGSLLGAISALAGGAPPAQPEDGKDGQVTKVDVKGA